MAPSALYANTKYLGPGGSMVARLKLKGIDGRAPPGVEPPAEFASTRESLPSPDVCGDVWLRTWANIPSRSHLRPTSPIAPPKAPKRGAQASAPAARSFRGRCFARARAGASAGDAPCGSPRRAPGEAVARAGRLQRRGSDARGRRARPARRASRRPRHRRCSALVSRSAGSRRARARATSGPTPRAPRRPRRLWVRRAGCHWALALEAPGEACWAAKAPSWRGGRWQGSRAGSARPARYR